MSFEKLFKLKSNPFRTVPAASSSEIVWAGFHELKEKIGTRIKRSMKIQNSTIVLNWGEYGSGKTHAVKYFNKNKVLEELAEGNNVKKPYSLWINLPKGRYPIHEIFTSIIDKLDLSALRKDFSDVIEKLDNFIDEITDNVHIRNVLKLIFSDQDELLVKKYLYNNINAADLKLLNANGILRRLDGEADSSRFIAAFFSCLTFEKQKYSCVIIWIDEFEDIIVLSNTNVEHVNNFLRDLFDNTPNNLLLFLNLTQSALINAEDLGQYLSEALKSRIKVRINFGIPNRDDLLQYLSELLNHENFRTAKVDNKYFPFTEDAIDAIIETLGNVSLRRYNEAFSLLLEIAEIENNRLIDKNFFEENKQEILPWKE